MSNATPAQFALVNDTAAATTKKLQKQAILAEYLASLAEPDLRIAVRYAAGRPFPATDERVLNVGGALVSRVALGLLGMSAEEFHDLAVRSGEIGEALSHAWPAAGRLLKSPQDPATAEQPDPWSALLLDPDRASTGSPGSSTLADAPSDAPLRLLDLADSFSKLATTGVWVSQGGDS